jgi:hypothetical protein
MMGIGTGSSLLGTGTDLVPIRCPDMAFFVFQERLKYKKMPSKLLV